MNTRRERGKKKENSASSVSQSMNTHMHGLWPLTLTLVLQCFSHGPAVMIGDINYIRVSYSYVLIPCGECIDVWLCRAEIWPAPLQCTRVVCWGKLPAGRCVSGTFVASVISRKWHIFQMVTADFNGTKMNRFLPAVRHPATDSLNLGHICKRRLRSQPDVM